MKLKREAKSEIRHAERESIADQVKRNPKNYSCLWKTMRLCIHKTVTILRQWNAHKSHKLFVQCH